MAPGPDIGGKQNRILSLGTFDRISSLYLPSQRLFQDSEPSGFDRAGGDNWPEGIMFVEEDLPEPR